MPQFGASLTDNARSVIYDHNEFIIQATGYQWQRKLSFITLAPGREENVGKSFDVGPRHVGPHLCDPHLETTFYIYIFNHSWTEYNYKVAGDKGISEMKSKQQSPCSACMTRPVTSWGNACSKCMHKPVRCMHQPLTSQARCMYLPHGI